MNEILKMCTDHECTFNNLELHPEHGWIVRVSYRGVRGYGESQADALDAVREAIRTSIHLYLTYHDRPQLIDLKDIDL